jgi:hypothetical protein
MYIYVCELANSSKPRPNPDSKIEDKVYMKEYRCSRMRVNSLNEWATPHTNLIQPQITYIPGVVGCGLDT